ncbi:DEAD/DEAH box helicase [Patescibacteria group bacterium]|nr:DEAD/DEAH box helicase [Patescibacteria group bacterium]
MLNQYTLTTPLTSVRGVGPTILKQASQAGINTVGDLVFDLPSRYVDRSQQAKIYQLTQDGTFTILAQVVSVTGQRYGRKTQQKAVVADDTGKVTLRWFNSPFVLGSLKINQTYYFSGKYSTQYRSMTQPTYEPVRPTQIHTGRLVPFYAGLFDLADGSKRRLLSQIFKLLQVEPTHLDLLLKKHTLPAELEIEPNLIEALKKVHFPDQSQQVTAARYRLALEEILSLMSRAKKLKLEWQKLNSAKSLPFLEMTVTPSEITFPQLNIDLPFRLTPDQITSIKEISHDLTLTQPMNRLLVGDVGSGKTVVAGIVAAHVVKQGLNACLIAPTQILADQHAQSLAQICPQLSIQLVTARHKLTPDKLQAPSLFIGTHALINKLTQIKPALVIFDEQHKFGVIQRSQLKVGADTPHVLTMSATPIPRSLMMTIFAHLKVSQIKTMPEGSLPTQTWLIPERKRTDQLVWLDKQLTQNPQALAMVVCPFIEPSKAPGLDKIKSVTLTTAELQKALPNLKVAMLHGRFKAEDQAKIIAQAGKGQIDLLVTTTVVEVGLDLPNADFLIIEAADRFGLASLHQLRGRVGRRGQDSFCFLFSASTSSESKKRLAEFAKINDGQKLAELDLGRRGAGDLFGTRQHGFDQIRFFGWTDHDLIGLAQQIEPQLPADWQSIIPDLQSNPNVLDDQPVAAN